MPSKKSFITVTDQFCGAGGSSQGAAQLGLEVYLAMNHWQLAIETHNANFPDTLHDCADVSNSDPRRYPSTDILITSPECTNHSVAKGVRRRQKQLRLFDKQEIDPSAERSRATMWDVPRFAEYHQYNIIVVENVVDARAWVMWDAWIHAMDSLGYDYHIVYFNSMFAHLDPAMVNDLHDFSPQSRDRMYVIFWKKGNKRPNLDFRPQAHCQHCDKQVGGVQSWKNTTAVRQYGGRWGRYGTQYEYRCPTCANVVAPYYYAAANAIDWSLPAERIGDRERPLTKKTIKRIQKGLDMFGNQHLVVDLAHSHGHNRRSVPIMRMMPTQTTAATMGLILNTLHADTVRDISQELPTQTTRQSLGLAFYLGYANGDGPPHSINDPLLTMHTENSHGLVQIPFMPTFRGTKDGTMSQAKGVDDATMGTVSAGGIHHGLVYPPFMMSYYGSGSGHSTVDEPIGTVTAVDRHALVQGQPKVDDCRFRMLQPHEVGRGMAFPDEYIVLGTKREQVRQYGNAVTPPVMKMLLNRCVQALQ